VLPGAAPQAPTHTHPLACGGWGPKVVTCTQSAITTACRPPARPATAQLWLAGSSFMFAQHPRLQFRMLPCGWLAAVCACFQMAVCQWPRSNLACPAGAFIVHGSTSCSGHRPAHTQCQACGPSEAQHQVRPYFLILMSAQFQYSCDFKEGGGVSTSQAACQHARGSHGVWRTTRKGAAGRPPIGQDGMQHRSTCATHLGGAHTAPHSNPPRDTCPGARRSSRLCCGCS
jgi:hypothetical protein